MKKVKKILTILLFTIILVGCGNNTARKAVEEYLNQYKNLNDSITNDLDAIATKENLDDEQKEKYKALMKRQYQDLEYKIIKEEYNGDIAIVDAKVTVYDLFKAQNDAAIYLNNNYDLFKDEYGIYNSNKYLNYKLDQMSTITDRVDYTITFNVKKDENGNYIVTNITDTDLEKIHGIYNYNGEN